MASVTMSATFLSGAALTRRPSLAAPRRSLVISAKAGGAETEEKREGDNGRREMVFAAAAAAVCSLASVAMAEPSRGTKEAKKQYAPVCVTMPTARICHK